MQGNIVFVPGQSKKRLMAEKSAGRKKATIPNRFENNQAKRRAAADMSLQNILGIEDEKVGLANREEQVPPPPRDQL